MKRIGILSLLILVISTASSCMVSYNNMVAPAASVKTGVVRKTVWFGLARKVDVSIATAAKSAGITKVATVDYVKRVGYFRTIYVTTVTGE